MKILYVALAALMCSAMATSAMAWVDNFDGYADGTLEIVSGGLWWGSSEDVMTTRYGNPVGYGDTKGVEKPDEVSTRGHAFRANGSGTTLTARLRISPYGDRCNSTVGYTRTTDWSAGNAWYAGEWNGADSVNIHLIDNNGATAYIQLNSAEYSDAGLWLNQNQFVTTQGFSINTWYDVELSLSGGSATGRVRESDGPGAWIGLGTVTSPLTDGGDPFEANYVGLSTIKAGIVDDVATIPEPSSLVALLAFGAPALAFMRRRR